MVAVRQAQSGPDRPALSGSGVRPERTSPLTTFEAPDPGYWVPHGYAIVIADIPGTWYSLGPATYLSPRRPGLTRTSSSGPGRAVEQRTGRPVRGVVPDAYAVAGGRAESRRTWRRSTRGRAGLTPTARSSGTAGSPRRPSGLISGTLGRGHRRSRTSRPTPPQHPFYEFWGSKAPGSRRSGCPRSSWRAGPTRVCTRAAPWRGSAGSPRRTSGSTCTAARSGGITTIRRTSSGSARSSTSSCAAPTAASWTGRGSGWRYGSALTRAPAASPRTGRPRIPSTGPGTWTRRRCCSRTCLTLPR